MNGISTQYGIHALEATSAQSERARMEAVATEFESVFLSLMLKEMRGSESQEGGLFGGEFSDSFGGLFDMFMGQHLAKDGPLGISKLLLDQYEKQRIAPAEGVDAPSTQLPPSVSVLG